MKADADVLGERLTRAARGAADEGVEGLLITPGAALTYLTGYEALPLERLTCLVLTASGRRSLIVPRLELPAADAAGIGALGIEPVPWDETDDPIARVADLLDAPGSAALAVDDAMPAAKLLALQSALPGVRFRTAGPVVDRLRMIKSADEQRALEEAGAAIDRVHARMGEWLRAGRTEREVGRDIADALLQEGHVRVDFVIVASGPNGASAHHEVSDRVIGAGEPIVVDIGGTMPSGYCSDCTRMYSVGTPAAEYLEQYAVLQHAQAQAVAEARPGMTAAALDAVARDLLTAAGLGEAFVHRTGHGIGLSTHEEPYIVASSTLPLEPGMAFSIEPGFYLEGRWGARIEDIVILRTDGASSVNHRTHDLVIL
jgi:Xaa-Pro aminopeptidase